MNLPNKLTMLRMALIPLFLLLMLWRELPAGRLLALLVFAAASLTDLLDGRIARAHGLVTDFGKLMDPLADKLLVMSALTCLTQVEEGYAMPALLLVVILAREFAVTALRTLAADNGVVLAADRWGKIKTASQMVWICYALLLLGYLQMMNARPGADGVFAASPWMNAVYWSGLALVVLATVGSGVNYIWKNRELFLNSK